MGAVVTVVPNPRAPNGAVSGKVNPKWEENVFNQNAVLIDTSEDFSFPQGGEQEIFNKGLPVITVAGIEIKITAKVKVFEKAGANQACAQGRVEASAGVTLGQDLPENCAAIP